MLFFIARPFGGAGTNPNEGIPYENEIKLIKEALQKKFRYAIIFDPYEVYIKDRINIFSKIDEPGRKRGKEVYRRAVEIASAADVLIACLPRRSMGSVDEIAAASRNGRLVICISPPDQTSGAQVKNWTVITHTVFEDNIYDSIDSFIEDLRNDAILGTGSV